MRHNWTVAIGLTLGALAWGQSAEEELKTRAMKAKLDAELATMKGELAAAQFGVTGPTVSGSPYSAEAVTESVQMLGDGNAIRRKTVVRVFRDGAGRTARQEADANGEFHTVSIFDPVANVTHVLNPQQKTAVSRPLAIKVPMKNEVSVEVEKKLVAEMAARGEMAAKAKIAMSAKADGGRTEQLPAQTMEGLRVEGTRVTSSIPAGTIGNDRPIETLWERWYSPDLQLVVMTKRHDPRTGDVTYQLTHLQRTEPAPYLFQVPADYKVESEANRAPAKKLAPNQIQ
jgi:hypothetical protein